MAEIGQDMRAGIQRLAAIVAEDPHHRHRPVGLLRRREIGSLSEFSRNEMGKL